MKCRSLLAFLGCVVSWLVPWPAAAWAWAAGERAERAEHAESTREGVAVGEEETARGGVVPPVLVEAVAPRVPEGALADGGDARVVVELVIDAEGTVVDAVVRRSAGAALDAAAVDAARASRFRAALRDGKPVTARVLHEVVFERPEQDFDVSATATTPAVPATEATPAEPATALAERETPSAVEVVVRGESLAASVRRSARAVEVVDLREEGRSASDMGEVLARATSVRVQRSGALGSAGRISLAGLSGERVRLFLDGLPLEFSGYPFGIANVPVALVDRAEVYQGVVPIRFGADALGGAVNLVTHASPRERAGTLSYELGSFETHRLALGLRRYDARTGLVVQVGGFFDVAENDYPVDVEVFDEAGRLSRARVRRFHDGYRAFGGSASVGVLDRPWADRLVLRGFAAKHDREVQHNTLMTVPYGEVTYGKATQGGTLSYAKRFAKGARVDATLGYAHQSTVFEDLSRCRYDWFGRCFLELPLSGETQSIPIDRRVGEHALLGRGELALDLAETHALRVAVAPSATFRRGRDRALDPEDYDPLRATRSSTSSVLGVEHEAELFDGRLSNIAFGKVYRYRAESEEKLPTGELRNVDASGTQPGWGDSLRFTLAERVYLKASYERATRLPSAEERFGDGALIAENLHLSPEHSHNVNVGLLVDDAATRLGTLRARLNGALRVVSDLVVLLGHGSYFQYANVLSARILALDAGAGWSAPGDVASVDFSLGLEDARNTSTSGAGAAFRGDRLPNRPYMHAGASVSVRRRDVVLVDDVAALTATTRYVHGFFLGWESAGSAGEKLRVPSQTVHALGLSHTARGAFATMTNSVEVHNVTDAPVYDFYGVQRPGRSVHWKLTLEHR